MQPEEAENEQDDDHQADEIDDAVHGATSAATILKWIVRDRTIEQTCGCGDGSISVAPTG